MLLERVALYFQYHPNAVKHLAANCMLFDEEKIEWLNAKVKEIEIKSQKMNANIFFLNFSDWPLVQPPDAKFKHRTLYEGDFHFEGRREHSAKARRTLAAA